MNDYAEIPKDLQEDDDNANAAIPDITDESGLESDGGGEHILASQDPVENVLDDLEGRAISALEEFKLHPGVRSSSSPGSPSLHEELAMILRPVLEVSAHVGPAQARANAVYRPNGVDQTVDEMYRRLNSDLILPVVLESCQSDPIPAKRAAALQFFHSLYKEWRLAGSYLDATSVGLTAGPYGEGIKNAPSIPLGGMQQQQVQQQVPPQMRPLVNRRRGRTTARRAELLRYWVEASAHCTSPGNFTNARSDGAVASRAILSASAALRPALWHVADRIGSADDAGALRLYRPLARMIAGVCRRLFVQDDASTLRQDPDGSLGPEVDALRSASVKFLEIVVACFSPKEPPGGEKDGAARQKKEKKASSALSYDDFALENLPTGHPVITKEALEEIGSFAFVTLRGLTLMGGQIKVDTDLLLMSEMDEGRYTANPTLMVLDIVKPAALAFLEVEAVEMEKYDGSDMNELVKQFAVARSTQEMDFALSQKTYALTINAVSMLATRRPTYFLDSARTLSLRTMDPPKPHSSDAGDDSAALGSTLSKASAMVIRSQLKASCLTLLRNTLSATSGGSGMLRQALVSAGMEVQADKALKMASEQAALKKANRATRNRAAIFYEWEAAADERSSKRQKRTDDALAQMRSARAAKGLGGGIQLPTSMTDACELVMLNIDNLPPQRPPSSGASADSSKRPADLHSLINAVMSNGASLSSDSGSWYGRDGGEAWSMEVDNDAIVNDSEYVRYALDAKALEAATSIVESGEVDDNEALRFDGQRTEAASEAFSRIVSRSSTARSKHLADLGNQVAARLAWTLSGVQPSVDLMNAQALASGSMESLEKRSEANLDIFSQQYPLVPCCLSMEMTPSAHVESGKGSSSLTGISSSLANRTLTEAYMRSCGEDEANAATGAADAYDTSLNVFLSSIAQSCENADAKPNDINQKRAAAVAAASLPQQLSIVPSVAPGALDITGSLCDVSDITKKAADAAKKSSNKTFAASAAVHAAKAAADKRATQALIAIRDVAFQRSTASVRRDAVDCAVGLASGRLPASASVEANALKLVMNILYGKSADIADCILASATQELERSANYAIDNHARIEQANEEADEDEATAANPLKPSSDAEKEALEMMSKPVLLFMALCVRRPEFIVTLLQKGSREKADVLAKAVRTNMSKLSKAAATKHGAAKVALQVSDMVTETESALFLSFLDNMVQKSDKTLPSQDLIDACHTIQERKVGEDGEKDVRYIIPVLSGITRDELSRKIPDLVAADNEVFKKGLRRMSERLKAHALLFRDEPDKDSLHGMTLCEQIVFLHQLDFAAVGLPQKRYLDAIRVCLDDDKLFTDRVIMAALDYISGIFLAGGTKLPLAYMRTIILTCSKHESLHSWICHVLLPRLIEGKVYEDKRQWEGWMRCAKMLEDTGEGVSSLAAIEQLPEEQLKIYRKKYPKKD